MRMILAIFALLSFAVACGGTETIVEDYDDCNGNDSNADDNVEACVFIGFIITLSRFEPVELFGVCGVGVARIGYVCDHTKRAIKYANDCVNK